MDSEFGHYWSDRYYRAQADAPVRVETIEKTSPIPDTNRFVLLRARAEDLQKGTDMTEQQAIMKAAELHPALVARHTEEIRARAAAGPSVP
jgi:hypothetical protein